MRPTLATLCFTAAALQGQGDRIRIDNDQVRVIAQVMAPGAKTPMHEHGANRVIIYLDAGSQSVTDPAGKSTEVRFTAGQVLWAPGGGRHVAENTGPQPFRVVEVELKNQPSSAAAVSELDPVQLDPKRYHVELENPQVRVVRARYGPHETGVMHEHGAHRVVVFLTDQRVQAALPGGAKQLVQGSAGDIRWAGTARHREENLSDQAFEVISVEIK